MLILTRKLNEEIIISSNLPAGEGKITIKILSASSASGGSVKLGIDAPPGIQILRSEVYEKIIQSTLDAKAQSKIKIKDISTLKLNKIEKTDG